MDVVHWRQQLLKPAIAASKWIESGLGSVKVISDGLVCVSLKRGT